MLLSIFRPLLSNKAITYLWPHRPWLRGQQKAQSIQLLQQLHQWIPATVMWWAMNPVTCFLNLKSTATVASSPFSYMVTSLESNLAVHDDPFSGSHLWFTPSVICLEGPQEKKAYCELTGTRRMVKEQVSRASTDLKSMLGRDLEGGGPGALES